MATIGEILVSLKTELGTFNAQMSEARASIGQIGETAAETQSAISSLSGAMSFAMTAFEAYVAEFSVREITEFINKQVEATAAIGHTANIIGVGVEAYQQLRYAAKQVGIEHDALDKGLEFFNKTIGLASLGVEKAKKGFEDLGVKLRDSAGNVKPLETLFSEVSTKIEGLANNSQRAGVESLFFGKSYAGIANLVSEGGAKIDEARAQAERLGIVMSKDDVEAAEKLKQKLSDLSAVMDHDFKKVVASSSEQIGQFTALLLAAEKAGRGFLDWAHNVPTAISAGDLDKDIAGAHAHIKELSDSLLKLASDRTKDASAHNAWLTLKAAGIRLELSQEMQGLEVLEKARHALDAPAAAETPKPKGTVLPEKESASAKALRVEFESLSASMRKQIQDQKDIADAFEKGAAAVDHAKNVATAYGKIQSFMQKASADQKVVLTAEAEAWIKNADTMDRAKRATEANAAEQKKWATAAQAETLRATTPMTAYLKKVEELNHAYGQTAMSSAEFQAQLVKLQKELGTALGDPAVRDAKRLQSAVEQAGRVMSSQFADAVVNGKDFSSVILAIVKDIEKMVLELLIVGPILDALKAKMDAIGNSAGGWGGWIGSLLGVAGGLAGSGAVPAHASGDIFTSPTIGEFGESGPEAIVPLARAANGALGVRMSGGGANVAVNVQVHNNSNAKVSVQQRPNTQGGRDIIVQLDEVQASRVRNGTSAFGREIDRSRGTRQQPIMR